MRKPKTPKTGKGLTAPSAHNREARRKAAAEKRKVADNDNPEGLPEAPHNSLFGKKKDKGPDGEVAAPKKKQLKRKEVIKTDPAVQALAQKKKRQRAEGEKTTAEAPAAKQAAPRNKPHAEAVDASKHMWEKLRSERTPPEERAKLVDEVLRLFSGKVAEVLQKHDAARVLQGCFKHGDTRQRDALVAELKGGIVGVARSHYGHFLLLSIVRRGRRCEGPSPLPEDGATCLRRRGLGRAYEPRSAACAALRLAVASAARLEPLPKWRRCPVSPVRQARQPGAPGAGAGRAQGARGRAGGARRGLGRRAARLPGRGDQRAAPADVHGAVGARVRRVHRPP